MTTEKTTKHEVTVIAAWLFAARQFSAKKDLRSFLNGVAISRGHIVGTNGHVIGAIRYARLDGLPELIIPNESIDFFQKAIKANKAAPRDTEITISWEHSEDRGACNCVMSSKGLQHDFRPLDGIYPDFTKVLLPNHTMPYGNPQFNPDYLVTFKKAAELLYPSADKYDIGSAHILCRGDNDGARVLTPGFPQFEGVIMPVKAATAFAQHPVCVELDKFLGAMKTRLVKDCEGDAAAWAKPGCISTTWLVERMQAYLNTSNAIPRNSQILEKEAA